MAHLIQLPNKPGQPVLVLYDITDDRARTKVSEALKDYGLSRVQFSAFIGKLTKTAKSELEMRLEKELGNATGVVMMLQLEHKTLEEMWFRGHV
jgi:CRISPR-associated protein Cas2